MIAASISMPSHRFCSRGFSSGPCWLLSWLTIERPTVGVSIVNFDNNQHGPDENLRLQNLWEGIEMLASLMTMPGGR